MNEQRRYPMCKPTSWPARSMAAGKRHETLGSETKDFTTRSTAGSGSVRFVSVALVPVPTGAIWRGPCGRHTQHAPPCWGTLTLGNPNLFCWEGSLPDLWSGGRLCITWGRKQLALYSGKHHVWPLRPFVTQTSLKRQSVLLLVRHAETWDTHRELSLINDWERNFGVTEKQVTKQTLWCDLEHTIHAAHYISTKTGKIHPQMCTGVLSECSKVSIMNKYYFFIWRKINIKICYCYS